MKTSGTTRLLEPRPDPRPPASGVPHDDRRAITLFRKAAAGGYACAWHGIAVQYGAHPVDQLHSCDHVYSAKTVAELHNWLAENA